MPHQDGIVLQKYVKTLEVNIGSNAAIFDPFDIPPDYPWREKMTEECNMYACLYALGSAVDPLGSVLEIGIGFGLSAMTWLRLLDAQESSNKFGLSIVTIDKGGFKGTDNIGMARKALFSYHLATNKMPILHFIQGDTQSPRAGWPWWYDNDLCPSLIRRKPFDILFVDGDHGCEERPWALFNDLWQFWPFLRPGGLCICDDMHDPVDYPKDRFPWLGYTWDSFHTFARMRQRQIADMFVWKFPFVPSGERPLGLLVKKLILEEKPDV